MRKWYEDYYEILALARYLAEVEEFDVNELLRFLEKPWHYNDYYTKYLQSQEQENV